MERVFNKSFTGENGKDYVKSTGMGLYIVKGLCDKLGHKIEINSVKNEYTDVKIIFTKILLIRSIHIRLRPLPTLPGTVRITEAIGRDIQAGKALAPAPRTLPAESSLPGRRLPPRLRDRYAPPLFWWKN